MFEFHSDQNLGSVTWDESLKFQGSGFVYDRVVDLIASGEEVEIPPPGPSVEAGDFPEWVALSTLRSVLRDFKMTGEMSDTTSIDLIFEVPEGGIA